MLSFLGKQEESFSLFQETRQKVELGTPHRVKLSERKKPTRGLFQRSYGMLNSDSKMSEIKIEL